LGGTYGVTNDTIVSNNKVELDPGQYASYLWQDDTTTTETFFASKTGWYSVTVADDQGCTYTDSVYLNVVKVGITEFTDNNGQLFIYPVPATTVLHILFYNPENEEYNLECISADGKQLFNYKIYSGQSAYYKVVDISNYSKGLYFVRVYNENFVQVISFIIQ
jgi:hypothetical protein